MAEESSQSETPWLGSGVVQYASRYTTPPHAQYQGGGVGMRSANHNTRLSEVPTPSETINMAVRTKRAAGPLGLAHWPR